MWHKICLRGDCESGLHGQIAARKLLKYSSKKSRLAWAKKHEQWTWDSLKSVLWSDVSKFESIYSNRCVFETQSRCTDDLCMCGSHCEAWRCGGALLVTLNDLFWIQGTQPVWLPQNSAAIHHPVWFMLFCGTMTQHTSRLCKGYLTKKESDGVLHQMSWPPQWDELDRRLKEKQPTRAQHVWELLQDCWISIPGDPG
jgi:hypothetical protein